ncbi:MAG: tRNA modification GTPase [Pirellulaceae bacterium]|nr:tRNA modification GTPase [Pirellulaceae bacterium]
MPLDLADTIAAIASPPGGAARGIVRISGPGTADCLAQVFVAGDRQPLPPGGPPRIIDGSALPRGTASNGGGGIASRRVHDIPVRLYLWPTERSYTRQQLAELHTFGSLPLLEGLLTALVEAGARLARPGEFTLRAFLAGRLDLTQAEAVLGVIDAQSQTELDLALSQLAGGVAGPLQVLRDDLLDLLAHLEAGLDFADEEIEFISPAELSRQLASAALMVEHLTDQLTRRGDSSRRPRVVLIGEPNAGKSSLLNALAGQAAAIVSPQAGTTRDFLAAPLVVEGLACELVDTAGIEVACAALESVMQSQTASQSRQADVTLLCLDGSREQTPWEETQLQQPTDTPRIIVTTKCDLAAAPCEGLSISSLTGEGLRELRQAFARELAALRAETSLATGTAPRCRESLREATAALGRARDAATRPHQEDLVAAEIRGALDSLGQVVGTVYTDDVLDRIFSRFCIGK